MSYERSLIKFLKDKAIKQITKQHFRVNNFDNLADFYVGILGMSDFSTSNEIMVFGFSQDSCHLCFHQKPLEPYIPNSNDFYWKIGITLKNIDTAVGYLRKQNIQCSSPTQFKEIGYMSKISDPKGFTIELLQQGFIGNEENIPNNEHPIKYGAILAHITLRISDLEKSKHYFGQKHNMRLMSIQSVAEYGFCLYFYSFSGEALPNEDLNAVENRQWLWKRDYTFIELQHTQEPSVIMHKTSLEMEGFDGFSYFDESEKYISYSSLVDDIL